MLENETCLFEIVDGLRVTWEITRRCNYCCKHCCNSSEDKEDLDEISAERALEIIDEMIKENVTAIYFSGGEPLLRKDIYKLIHYAKKKGIAKINLASNGSTITSGIARKLSKLGLDSVLVSLDSHDSQVHDYLRGIENSFDNALRGISFLVERGVNVRIGTVVWKGNCDSLEDILILAISKGAKSIYFNWLLKTGRCVDNENILLDPKKYKEIARKLLYLREKYKDKIKVGYHRYNEIHEDFPDCLGGEKIIHITPKGYIAPCSWVAKYDSCFTTTKSLNEVSFKELLTSNSIKKFREDVTKRSSCMGKGCPAMCYSENGLMMSKDPLYFDGGKYV